MARIVVGLYHHIEDARQVVESLVNNGFSSEAISLVAADTMGEFSRYANEAGTRSETEGAPNGVGAVIGRLGRLLVGLGVLAIAEDGMVLAAGPLVAILTEQGSLSGALAEMGIPEEQAERYAESVRRGGTLVTVRTSEAMATETAVILNRFHPADVNPQVEPWQAEAAGLAHDIHPEEAQPMNLDTVSGTPLDEIRPRPGEASREPGEGKGGGFQQPEEGGEAVPGHVALPPDEHDLQITMRDADEESRRAMDRTTAGSGPSAGYSVPAQSGSGLKFFDPVFRQHFKATYSNLGRNFADLRPAYVYGANLARDPRYRKRTWEEIELDASRAWEQEHADGAWEDYRDAVRAGWETATFS